jgi:hypothetical protein
MSGLEVRAGRRYSEETSASLGGARDGLRIVMIYHIRCVFRGGYATSGVWYW